MADARADIIIDVDTSVGIAEIKNLQRQIAQLNAQLLQSGAQQARAAQNVQRNLINNINATGQFSARVKTITSTTESFTRALETNKMSMGQYFKYAGGASKTFGKLFKSEFDTVQKVAESRVKTLQTQFVKLGRDANGAMKAIAVRPLALDMENLSTKTAIAAQKQQLFNQLIKQGSTNLLNFGKNTQWAGRQLMVGFSVPLAYLGTIASKTFMKMEEQAIRFKRVYGDSFTSSAETDKMIKQVQQLASEFTKYGVQVEKTMEMAANAAAMGKMGADLLAQINQATRLAVLGGVEQEQALETTISLTNAFGIAADQLAGKINFLNAVENQTVTAIEDLTIAIPKAGPVIQQLGGDVEDLAFFLTAMKEGGINASEGANALKSGLASLINPTAKASEFLQGFGINLKGIVDSNKGNVKGIVVEFAQALDTLDPLNRARAIEQLFGKFQFSRLSTLFQNVIAEGSQAERVLKLSSSTAQELAILSERELKRVEDSPMYKFKKAVEDLKVSLVPLGEAFLKAITPLVEFAKGFLDKFNSMGEGAKNFAVIATTVVAGIGPVLLMTFGLIANGVANLIKMFSFIGRTMSGAGKSSMDLGAQTEYMTQQQLEAAAVASSLDQKHAKLIQTFSVEAGAVNNLATAYARAVVNQSKLLGINPETGAIVPKGAKAPRPKKYNSGVLSVPGPKGAGDIVPAMLSPGEAVIPAKQSKKYSGLIQAMISDSVPGYRFGLNPFAAMLSRSRVAVRTKQADLAAMLQAGKGGRYKSAFETNTGADYIDIAGRRNVAQELLRSRMEEKVFGLGRDTPASARPTYGYARTSPFQAFLNRVFGFKGKQYNAITTDFTIGDRGKQYGYKDPKTGMFGPTPDFKSDTLDRYGDVDIVTKRSVARRSQAAVTDALMDFERMGGYPGFKLSPVSMRGGKGNFENARFDRLSNPFGRYQSDPINYPNQWTANPKPPYVETYTPGGFGVNEISKIIAKDRSAAKQIQKLVDQAGLKIRVTPQNAPMVIKAFSNIFGTRFEGGTAKAPKLDYSQASTAGIIAAHGHDFKTLTDPEAKAFAELNLDPNGRAYKNFMSPTGSGRNVYSNFVFGMPGAFNTGQMSGRDAGRWISGNRDAFFSYLSKMYGMDAESPAARKFATTLSTKLTSYGNLPISDSIFYSEIEKAQKTVRNKAFRDIFASASSDFGTGEVFGSSGKSRREALAGKTRSYTRSRDAIRERYNAAAIDFDSSIEKQPVSKSTTKPISKPAVKKAATKKSVSRQQSVPTAQKQVAAASLSKILAAGNSSMPITARGKAGIFARLFKPFKFNSGVVSVPGPKGAGDIVPAMLSPGEAVIPAKESKKYAPLINGMINDSIPGYFRGRTGAAGSSGMGMSDRAAEIIGKGLGQVLGRSRILASSIGTAVSNGIQNSPALNKAASWLNGGTATVVSPNGKEYNNGAEVRTDKRGRQYYVDPGNGRISKAEFDARQQQAAAAGSKPKLGARMAGPLGGIGAAASMAGMGMMMSGDPGMQQAGGAVMMAGMLAPMLPMLMNPIGALVAAVGLVGFGLFKMKEELDNTRKAAGALAETFSSGRKAMDGLAEFAGTVNPAEAMDRIRAERRSGINIVSGKTTFGGQYLESEDGKNLLKQAQEAKLNDGGQLAAKNMAIQLSQAVSSKILTAKQAASIASNLGAAMKDYDFAVDVNAEMVSLLGPGGEDLTKNPLKVKVELVEAKQETLTGAGGAKDLISNVQSNMFGGRFNYNEVAAAEMQYAKVFTDIIDMGQQNLDQLELEHIKRLEVLQAAGDLAGIEAENSKYAKDRAALLAANAATLKEEAVYLDSLEAAGGAKRDSARQIVDNLEAERKKLFEGADNATKNLANLTIENIANEDSLTFAEKATLTATITVENMDLMSQVQNLFPVGKNVELWKKVAQVTVELGTGSQTDLLNILPGFTDATKAKQFTEYVVDVTVNQKNPEAATAAIDTMTTLSKIKDEATGEPIKLDQFIDDDGKVTKKFEDLTKKVKEVNKAFATTKRKDKKITYEVFTKVTGLTLTKSAQAYFDSLPADQQKTYTTTYLTITESIDANTPEGKKRIKEWRASKQTQGSTVANWAAGLTDSQVIQQIADEGAWQRTENAGGITNDDEEEEEKPKDDGGGNKPEDPYKPYLERLKQLRNASIKVTDDLKTNQETFNKVLAKGSATISKFAGTDRKLLFSGYSTEFINAVNGMDEETKKRFVSIKNGIVTVTNEGKKLQRALSEIKLGEFSFSLVAGVAAINKQKLAMTKLTKEGMSSADAFEIVQDESLAYAIATAATTEEVKQLVEESKNLKKAQQELAFTTPQGTQAWLDEYAGKVSAVTSRVNQWYDAQRAIVDQDFAAGENKSGKNKDLINIEKISDALEAAQNTMFDYQYNMDNLQYSLSTIEDKEDEINKKYDERAEALNKIWEANSDIAEQQKAQLDIAQALASGDISAAARAMQEEQRRRAQKAKEDQEKALDLARTKELESLKSSDNKTRKQLEAEILELSKKMTTLEEEKIEPNERLLKLAEDQKKLALEAVGETGYLGQTEAAWQRIESAARLATVQSEAFRKSLQALALTVPGFSVDKDGNLVFDDSKFAADIPQPNLITPKDETPPEDNNNGDGGSGDTNNKPQLNTKDSSYAVLANAKAGLYENAPAKLADNAGVIDKKDVIKAADQAVNKGGITIGDNTIKATNTADFAKQVMDIVLDNRAAWATASAEQKKVLEKENIKLMQTTGLRFANGGMVPKYFAAGGFAKGTDTVPAMLTPGEFVMKRYAVNKYGTDTMKAINSGTFSGDSVYNYEVNVNVKSDANPDQIASAVMSRINQIDSQRIRSNRY
jgi:TP901 family phage tail tape measure protein